MSDSTDPDLALWSMAFDLGLCSDQFVQIFKVNTKQYTSNSILWIFALYRHHMYLILIMVIIVIITIITIVILLIIMCVFVW